MNDTATIDGAIDQVERLYRSVTGKEAPTITNEAYATIPPEKVPEEHVQEQVDRLVEALTEFSGKKAFDAQWRPAISLWEGRNEVLICVDLPGVEREAIHVAVNRGLLEINGTRPVRSAQDGAQFELKYAEHSFGKFRRTIPLPASARIEQLEAKLQSGVLEIRIPRESEALNVKTIHIG